MPKLFSGPEDRRIKRALCIVAHPDDIEFYCAGAILLMTRHGAAVDFVLATSGDKGARDASKSRAKVARIREREQELDAAWPSARDPLTFPQAGPPHETAEAWCFGGVQPTLEIDVGDVLAKKIEARLAHASQTTSPAALMRRWRAVARVEKFHQVNLR